MNEVASTGAVRPAAPVLTKEQVLEFVAEPLKQLPADWRIPVWDFWAYFENLLPTQISLCTRLRRWRDHEGLTIEELQSAMDYLRTLEGSAGLQFGSQVLDSLGERIREYRAARDRAERAAGNRKALIETYQDVGPGVVPNLAESFRMPGRAPLKPSGDC